MISTTKMQPQLSTYRKGQVSLSIAAVGSIIIAMFTGTAAYYGSVSSQQVTVASIRTDVAVLQKSDSTQDSEIETLIEKLNRIDGNVVKLLVKNGLQP